MSKYELKKVSEESPHYNIIYYKEVTRRNGNIELDVETRLYSTHFENAINNIAHKQTQDDFGDKNVSLKTYLSSFYKNWNRIYNENC